MERHVDIETEMHMYIVRKRHRQSKVGLIFILFYYYIILFLYYILFLNQTNNLLAMLVGEEKKLNLS
jgi:hypothetical protein